jgi:hypothetical protein
MRESPLHTQTGENKMQNIKLTLVVFIATIAILWGANAALAESPSERACGKLADLYGFLAEARDGGIEPELAATTLLEAGLSVEFTSMLITHIYIKTVGYSPDVIRAVAYEGCLGALGEAI